MNCPHSGRRRVQNHAPLPVPPNDDKAHIPPSEMEIDPPRVRAGGREPNRVPLGGRPLNHGLQHRSHGAGDSGLLARITRQETQLPEGLAVLGPDFSQEDLADLAFELRHYRLVDLVVRVGVVFVVVLLLRC